DVVHDVLDGPLRIEQAAADLGRVLSVGEQLEHLDLAIGQDGETQTARVKDLALQPADLVEQAAEKVWRERAFAARGGANGLEEIVGRRLIAAQNTSSPRLEGTE